MDSETLKRYIRWQDYRIAQLSFSINLFLGFTVASLAYLINLKLSGNVKNPDFLFFIIKFWAWSASLGCIATTTRLLDFRFTASKIKNKGRFNSFMAKYLGSITWGMFWGQIITYVSGAYCFLFGVVSA